jgi:hypothetical protein
VQTPYAYSTRTREAVADFFQQAFIGLQVEYPLLERTIEQVPMAS